MAVATSKYDAESSNLSDRSAQIYKDLNLNFTLHQVKKDVSTLSDISAIKSSVRNLINLNLHGKYEKPFHPEIGASIRDALFEPNDSFSINVDVDWQSVKTGNTSMSAGQGYFVDTSSGAINMTLPSSASAGDTIAIKDYAGTFATNSCVIVRNGHNIQGIANN